MYQNKRIAVVVPCKNEATQIGRVLSTMPAMVDAVLVIDDGSTDGTADAVRAFAASTTRMQVEVIRHEQSRGVGGAIATGYVRARDEGFDITVVMAGDGQMDPLDFESVIEPVALDQADYVKGNRFQYPGGLQKIPRLRKFGNFVLSVLTKFASGYWHVSDTQCGYTAISLTALRSFDVAGIFPRYGCPNDILIKLNIADMRVVEVPVNPLYNVGEKSKMRIPRIIGPILRLLAWGFVRRMAVKYVIMSGHPLIVAYAISLLSVLLAVPLGLYIAAVTIASAVGGLWYVPGLAVPMFGLTVVVALQAMFSGLWMDCDDNRPLCIHLTPTQRLKRWHGSPPAAVLATPSGSDSATVAEKPRSSA